MAKQRSKRDAEYNRQETLGDALYKFVSAKVLFDEGLFSRYYFVTVNSNEFMGRMSMTLGLTPQYEYNKPINGTSVLDKAYADEFEVFIFNLYEEKGMDAIETFFIDKILPLLQVPGALLNFMRSNATLDER